MAMSKDEKDNCRVLISGISGVNEDVLTLFFESKRLCPNGGEVEHFLPLTDDQGVLIFKDSQVAKRLGSSLVMHDGRRVSIRPYEKLSLSTSATSEASSFASICPVGSKNRDIESSEPVSLDSSKTSDSDTDTKSNLETSNEPHTKEKFKEKSSRFENIERPAATSQNRQAKCQSSEKIRQEKCQSSVKISKTNHLKGAEESCKMQNRHHSSFENAYYDSQASRNDGGFSRSNEFLDRFEDQCRIARRTSEEPGLIRRNRASCRGDISASKPTTSLVYRAECEVQKPSRSTYSLELNQQETHKIDTLDCNLTLEKLQLLNLIWNLEGNRSPYDRCVVKFDEKLCRVTLEGTNDNLENTKFRLLELAHLFESEVAQLSPAIQKILQSKQCKEWLSTEFARSNLHAVFFIKDGKPYLIGRDETTLQSAIKHLHEIVSSQTVPLETSHRLFLKSSVWTQKMEKLRKSFLISIVCNESLGNIEISGRKTDVQTVAKEIHHLLLKNVQRERIVKRHCGVVRLLAKKERTIQEFISLCVSAPVELSFMGSDAFIKIKGLQADVDIAADVLVEYSSNVVYGTVEVDTPGIKKEMFVTKNTPQQDMIELLENRHECAIEVRNYKTRQEAKASVPNQHSSSEDQKQRVTPATNIKVVPGNITKFKADILVNTIADGNLERGGMVLKQFLEAGGPKLEQELCQFKIPVEFGKDVALTLAHGKIDAKFVLHAAVAKFEDEESLKKLYSTIKKCLEIAMSKKATTIAFPTLGCGKLAFSPENMISCFLRAERDTKTSLKIFVVAFEEGLLRRADSHLQELVSSDDKPNSNEAIQHKPNKFKEWIKKKFPGLEHSKETASTFFSSAESESNLIVFHINTMSNVQLDQVKIDLTERINAMTKEEPIKDDVIAQLDEEQLSTIRELGGSKVHVVIDQSRSSILLKGERTAVEHTRPVILTILASIHDIDLYPVYWINYKFPGNASSNAKAFRVPLLPSSSWYNQVSQVIMKTWDQQKVGQGFDAKGLKSHTIKILKITCNECPLLMDKYMAKKKSMTKAASSKPFRQLKDTNNEPEISTMRLGLHQLYGTLSKEVNEVFLLHGTKPDALTVIESDGIDTRVCGSHPLFGFGAYFAESSTKADQYADPKEKRTSPGQPLYMYLCRVLLGSVYVCDDPKNVEGFKRPPCMKQDCQIATCTHTARYDSVVGTHRPDPARSGRLHFREFIVYHPEQSYPDFLIEYQRVKYP